MLTDADPKKTIKIPGEGQVPDKQESSYGQKEITPETEKNSTSLGVETAGDRHAGENRYAKTKKLSEQAAPMSISPPIAAKNKNEAIEILLNIKDVNFHTNYKKNPLTKHTAIYIVPEDYDYNYGNYPPSTEGIETWAKGKSLKANPEDYFFSYNPSCRDSKVSVKLPPDSTYVTVSDAGMLTKMTKTGDQYDNILLHIGGTNIAYGGRAEFEDVVVDSIIDQENLSNGAFIAIVIDSSGSMFSWGPVVQEKIVDIVLSLRDKGVKGPIGVALKTFADKKVTNLFDGFMFTDAAGLHDLYTALGNIECGGSIELVPHAIDSATSSFARLSDDYPDASMATIVTSQ